MRHLKTYKIFETIYSKKVPRYHDKEIVDNLKDIFYSELEDNFISSYDYSPIHESIPKITVTIYKKRGGYFKISEDVYDYLQRVYQFMRESGWYSNLRYSLGGGIKKKFYLRPDGRIRNQDIAWMDENWPDVWTLELEWYKSYDDKIQENVNRAKWSERVIDTMVWEYGEEMKDMIDDILNVEDILLDVDDLGHYHTSVGLTPMTHAGAAKNPQMYIDIKRHNDSKKDFYGDFSEYREIVDTTIEEVLNYLDKKGYKLKHIYDNKLYKPSEFSFINNPTSYQMIFTKPLNKDVSGESGI